MPEDVAANLPGARARLQIEICGASLSRALRTDRAIGPCFMVGQAQLRSLGLVPGQSVEVSLMADPNPDEVPIPEELAEALAQDPEAAAKWHAATPGRQRGLAYRVDSAKNLQTRADRAIAVLRELHTGPPPRRSRLS